MLVLTQAIGDAVHITLPDGVEIQVTLLGLVGGKARMGYDAPKDIVIDREEIYRRKKIQSGEINGNE